MIDDDERREVAARLAREAQAWRETFPDSECDFSDAAAMMQDLCVFIGLERNALCSEVFQRLADLINRPTCKPVIPNEMEGYVFCHKCGAEIGEYGVPNYCYNCGMEIEK